MLDALAIGTLGQYLTVAGVLVVAWLVWRGGGSAALGVLQTANGVLEKRVHVLEVQAKADARTIEELRAKTDIATALEPLVAAVMAHEAKAADRFDKTTVILDLIASRLGRDGDTAT